MTKSGRKPSATIAYNIKSLNLGKTLLIEDYSLGNTTTIKIVTSISTYGLPSKTVRLTGVGMIMRIEKIKTNHNGKKFGVALKFGEKLKLNV
jgi:hypothetical protein